MSILDKIGTTKPGAPRLTIYGKPGIGKSTFAAQFPEPLFLLTEDCELPGIQALPVATNFGEVWENVKQLLALDELPFQTLVIDSISKLDTLVIERILEQEETTKSGKKATTLAAAGGGYGAGYAKAQRIHRAFKTQMDKFKERGITVVYVSHLCVTKHKSPDAEDYDMYSIIMNHDKSREVYIDDVDAVLFCKIQSYVKETESGRNLIVSSDQRVIVSGISDGHVSKNRYGMPSEIPMSFTELAKYIPFYIENKEQEDVGL